MRQTFKHAALAVAVAGALSSGAAMAEVSMNIGAVSQYYFRGTALSDSAAVQGGVDYNHDSGFYAGAWASGLEGGDPSYELDLYAGFSGEAAGLGYDVGYIAYTYPDASEDADYGELYGALSYSVFTVGLAYTVNSDVDDDVFTEGDLYYYGQVDVPLAEDYSVGAVVGYYDFDVDGEAGVGDASYTHFGLSLSKDAGDYGSLSLNLEKTDIDDDHYLGGDNSDDPKIWVGWSKTF